MKRDLIYYLPYLLILYLTLSGNYLAELFGCQVQNILTNNIIVKHIIGYLTLTTFVIYSTTQDPFHALYISLFLYSIFLLSTRVDYRYLLVSGILLFALFFIYSYQNRLESSENTETNREKLDRLKQLRRIIFYILMFVLILGFTIYLGRKSYEYPGKKWSWYQYATGTLHCKFDCDVCGKYTQFQLAKRGVQTLFHMI